ncbi:hypothetical protein PSD17_25680 [Pseudonocardia sp. D17]|nr:hypothetical protein PSD17_25680 [Pseudonocardia sp. D17]
MAEQSALLQFPEEAGAHEVPDTEGAEAHHQQDEHSERCGTAGAVLQEYRRGGQCGDHGEAEQQRNEAPTLP